MKKIVGILGMAAMLGSAAFAAEPAANFVMADFTGSMDFGWESDLANEKYGFYNKPDTTLKFGFVDAGDKTTTGSGVWGELKIEAGATSVTNGKIKVGNVKDDHWSNIQKDNITYDKDADGNKTDAWLNLPNLFPTASVAVAKIHFVDGDFKAALNLKAPSLNYDNFTPAAATGGLYGAGGITIDDKDAIYTNGFGLNLGYSTYVDFNFTLKTKEICKDNKFAMAFDTTVKPIDDLKIFAAGSFDFENEKTGFGATADYKLGFGEKLYVKPGVGFSFLQVKKDATKSLAAGLLFGWGAENQKPELPFVNTDSDKFNEGVSVTVATNMEDKGLKLNVGLYDQSVLSLLGDGFGTLKTGVSFTMAQSYEDNKVIINKTKNDLAIGAKYENTFSPIYITLKGGMAMTMIEDAEKNPLKYSFGAQIGSKEIVDNTDIYVAYDLAGDSDHDKLTTNDIKVGTKISF